MDNKIIHTATTKTGKTISFRYPTIADVEILKDYIKELSVEKTFILFQGQQKTLEQEKKGLKEKIKAISENKAVFILAFINGKLAGLSDVELQPMAKSHVGDLGITVAKKYRGEEIGKLLMGLVLVEAVKKIRELKIITLECFAINIAANNLYRKLGFVEYDHLPDGLKCRGKFSDSILMYKKI
ncbi:MAG: GNAT family protein [Candidatus Shapirobacteria bacterium]